MKYAQWLITHRMALTSSQKEADLSRSTLRQNPNTWKAAPKALLAVARGFPGFAQVRQKLFQNLRLIANTSPNSVYIQ
jgi:hypothetical protein